MELTGPGGAPGEATCTTTLPGVGTLTLLASNAALSRFRQRTRERGLGPLHPRDTAGQPIAGARPGGIELRDRGWDALDEETFPLLVAVLAETYHPQLTVRAIEDACTPAVMAAIGEPVLLYLTGALVRLLAPAPGGPVADPPAARGTPTSSSARSGPTP
jgi:hypothetical protein